LGSPSFVIVRSGYSVVPRHTFVQSAVFSAPCIGSVPEKSWAFQRLAPPLSPTPARRQPSTPNAMWPALRFVDSVGGSSVARTMPR
jgi:hypothetical protein